MVIFPFATDNLVLCESNILSTVKVFPPLLPSLPLWSIDQSWDILFSFTECKI